MSTHDPLCLRPWGQRATCRYCALIAQVVEREDRNLGAAVTFARADEREQVARDIERIARQFDRDAMAVLVGARVARRNLP